jgi:hemerythrin-like domain-containing protein
MSAMDSSESRRGFLLQGGVLLAATALGASTRSALAQVSTQPAQPERPRPTEHEEHEDEEVSPGEDLMREHGVLKRILLIYEEAERRLQPNGDGISPDPIHKSAEIIRSFIEDYHEKLEENYLFPRFRKANRLVELVDVLQKQHAAGRRVTERTLELATAANLKDDARRGELARMLGLFVRMYSPHEAREDTVLFPALHEIVSRNEYDALGEDFEKKEHELLGENGFEAMVDRVAAIEKSLGIYDLAQFTPKI